MDNKTAFAPLLKVHDKEGEFQTLLQANGFQVQHKEVELLMSLSKWHRMVQRGEKIPELNIKNINKFRDLHVQMLHEEHMKAQEEAMKAAQAAQDKKGLEIVGGQ